MPKNSKTAKCSFCGRDESQVGILLTGLHGYICGDCALTAANMVREQLGLPEDFFSKKTANQKFNTDFRDVPKPKEIKAFLD